MKFKKIDNEEENGLTCDALNNDLLFRKYHVKLNEKVKLQSEQFLILVENGQVLDIAEDEGMYNIEEGEPEDKAFIEMWENVSITKSTEEPLSVIFLNKKEIKQNRYISNTPIPYEEKWIKVEGYFHFYLQNPRTFLERVIGLRNHFSKQELLEQIRKYVIGLIEEGISELIETYHVSIEDIQKKANDFKNKVSENAYDKKLLEYGVKVTYFDIENLEWIEKKKRKFFK